MSGLKGTKVMRTNAARANIFIPEMSQVTGYSRMDLWSEDPF